MMSAGSPADSSAAVMIGPTEARAGVFRKATGGLRFSMPNCSRNHKEMIELDR